MPALDRAVDYVPSQLRNLVKEHHQRTGVDLTESFRAMGPHREPIPSQRWILRRIGLTAAVVAGGSGLVALLVQNLRGIDLL